VTFASRDESKAANAVFPIAVGIIAKGRIVLARIDVHSELIFSAFELENAATGHQMRWQQ
jgi:hypothetical protein